MGDTNIKYKEHKKIRNTGLLMELLQRQIVTDLLNTDKSKAYEIIQRCFNPKTELFKEYRLFESLMNEKFKGEKLADEFVNKILESRKQINNSKLKIEKYNLLKEIKDNYGIERFLTTRISNYKMYASISNLFESVIGNTVEPVLYARSKEMVLEHIQPKQAQEIEKNDIDDYKTMSRDLRSLAYKLMVETYNAKYSVLNSKQKELLSEYVTNLNDTAKLKKHINNEIVNIKKVIADYTKKVNDTVIQVKLQEAQKNLIELKDTTPVTETLLENMLLWYELIDSIDNTLNK